MVSGYEMANVYTVGIEVSGNINGEDFSGKGHSEGDPSLGNPSVSITYSNIPHGSSVLGNFIAVINMLSTLMSREIGPAKGFLSLTNGDYGFSRSVEGPRVALYTTGTMQRVGPRDLLLKAKIAGRIAQAPTSAVDKWEGVQVPDGAGRVREVMVVPVRVGPRRVDTVYVITSYNFDPSVSLPAMQIREIQMNAKMTGSRLDAQFTASIRRATARKTSK